MPTSGSTQPLIIPDPGYPTPCYGLWRYLHNLKYEINLGLPSLFRVKTFCALVGSYSPLSSAPVAFLAPPLSSTARFLALELSDWITFAPQHHRTSDLFSSFLWSTIWGLFSHSCKAGSVVQRVYSETKEPMASSTQWNSMRTSVDVRQILERICLGGYYKRCEPSSRVFDLGLQFEGTAYVGREYMVAVTFGH